MKRIEDIERLSAEDLERIAGNESVVAPSSLRDKVMAGISAVALAEEEASAEASGDRAVALDGSAAVCEGDGDERATTAADRSRRRPHRIVFGVVSAAVAVAAAVAIVVSIPYGAGDGLFSSHGAGDGSGLFASRSASDTVIKNRASDTVKKHNPVAPQEPKDTFDDPMLAYAELERTLNYISSKMDKGRDIATRAANIIRQ